MIFCSNKRVEKLVECCKTTSIILNIRETDKQHICVKTQLKKTFSQLKLKRRVLIRR